MLWAAVGQAQELPAQTLVFYNARLALRDRQPTDALKLWLLRNSLKHLGEKPTHDQAFIPVVWAAIGNLGMCADALPRDADGLWPLAVHNQVLQLMVAMPDELPAPYDAFETGRQQRLISLSDVLSDEELTGVSFFRTHCDLPQVMATEEGVGGVDLSDRESAGRLLKALLQRALKTVQRERVEGAAVLETRLFDLDLALIALRVERLQQAARETAARTAAANMSRNAAADAQRRAEKFEPTQVQAAFLRRALQWQPREWLALSEIRRAALFTHARGLAEKDGAPLALGLIDALISARKGGEVGRWIGALGAEQRSAVFEGERGERLLNLDEAAGFRERAVIALHRGVSALQRGQRDEAFRQLAVAMSRAPTSRVADKVLPLARRWMSYVLAQYEVNDELLATLHTLIPRQEHAAVIEDLLWRAAFRADAASFQRLLNSVDRAGSLLARAEQMKSLAAGRPAVFATQLRDRVPDEPYFALRMIRQLIERLELEDADVRAANVDLLRALVGVMDALSQQHRQSKAHVRAAEELTGRLNALLESLDALDATSKTRARALTAGAERFAGHLRLAPSDPLPWPFEFVAVEAPTPFLPLTLTPVEWRGDGAEPIWGWSISE